MMTGVRIQRGRLVAKVGHPVGDTAFHWCVAVKEVRPGAAARRTVANTAARLESGNGCCEGGVTTIVKRSKKRKQRRCWGWGRWEK